MTNDVADEDRYEPRRDDEEREDTREIQRDGSVPEGDVHRRIARVVLPDTSRHVGTGEVPERPRSEQGNEAEHRERKYDSNRQPLRRHRYVRSDSAHPRAA